MCVVAQCYVLANIELEVIDGARARVRSQWAKVQPPSKFQGGLLASTIVVPDIFGITMFVPDDVLLRPIFMFVNYIHGRRIRVSQVSIYSNDKLTRLRFQPGLIVGVTVFGTPPTFEDVRLETFVSVNLESRTTYSGEVSLEGLSRGTGLETAGSDLDEARDAILLEMAARGESVGAGTAEEYDALDEDEKHQVDPSEKVVEQDSGVRTTSETEPDSEEDEDISEEEEEGLQTDGDPIGCKGFDGDHCIDDMYA